MYIYTTSLIFGLCLLLVKEDLHHYYHFLDRFGHTQNNAKPLCPLFSAAAVAANKQQQKNKKQPRSQCEKHLSVSFTDSQKTEICSKIDNITDTKMMIKPDLLGPALCANEAQKKRLGLKFNDIVTLCEDAISERFVSLSVGLHSSIISYHIISYHIISFF